MAGPAYLPDLRRLKPHVAALAGVIVGLWPWNGLRAQPLSGSNVEGVREACAEAKAYHFVAAVQSYGSHQGKNILQWLLY